jgi:hypothetical protein
MPILSENFQYRRGYHDFIVIYDTESPPSYFNDYEKFCKSLDNVVGSVDVIAIHRSDKDIASLEDTLMDFNLILG